MDTEGLRTIREGKVTDIWKSAVVIPAPKINPPRSISSDLRPISLLPVLAKVLESSVVNWFHDLLAPALDRNQFGCLKDRSTSHALISLLNSWRQTLDKGGSVRALFVDFSKAFDRVDHNVIVSKPIDRGVPHSHWYPDILVSFIVHWVRTPWLVLRRSRGLTRQEAARSRPITRQL